MGTGVLSKITVASSNIDHKVKSLLFKQLAVDTVTALGSTQATGVALTASKNVVLAADDAVGVVLPPAKEGMAVEIVNTVSNKTLLVYAAVGEVINAISTTAAFSLVGGAVGRFHCDALAHWYVAAANLTGTATSATTGQLDIAAVPASGVETVAATNIIAASESGKTFFLSHATEFVSTLPAPAAGLNFTFIVVNPPETASYTVVTDSAAQVLGGHVLPASGDAGDVESPAAGTTITFVDGAAVAGDRAYVISDGTSWYAVCSCAVATGITITG